MTKFSTLKTRLGNVRSKLNHLALIPAVALMSSPAFAALPAAPAMPAGTTAIGGGAVGADFVSQMGGWFKFGVNILVVIIAALAIVYVMSGALTRWKTYKDGRADISDLKEYFLMGTIFTVFIIGMATYGLSLMN